MVSSYEATRSGASLDNLSDCFARVRRESVELCESLAPEDMVVQSMPDVSPTKWHLAHITWFFEKFVLEPYAAGYQPFDEQYHYLFNSYYYTAGDMHKRPRRGLLAAHRLGATAGACRGAADGRGVVDARQRRLRLHRRCAC